MRSYLQKLLGLSTNVKLLLLRTLLMSLFTGIYGIIFNLYVLEIGYPMTFLGLVLSLHVLASSAVSIPAGYLCDRMDRKKLLVYSGFLLFISTLPMFVYTSPLILIAASALTGIFTSISSVCVTPLFAQCSDDDERVHVFSANASLGWIATVAGSALGGILPGIFIIITNGAYGGYRLTLLVSALLLALAWAAMLLLKDAKPVKNGERALSLNSIKVSPDVLKFILTGATFGIGTGMIAPYFNVYFLKVISVGTVEIGLVSAAAGAFMIGGFMITPYMTSKIGKVRSAVATKILSVPFLAFMAITTNFFIASSSYAFYMFFINMAGPATTSFQMERIEPGQQGFAMGLMSTGSYLAVSAGTYISGLLIAAGDHSITFIGACIAYTATALLLYHYFKDCEKGFCIPNILKR
jgi:predicted MFS family arabinose efflux permease